MTENDANAANYTELANHIERLGNKMNALNPSSSAYAETKEDMEDYYERLVQMKTMRITTLEEELADATTKVTALVVDNQRERQTLLAVVFAAIMFVACAIECAWPDSVLGPLEFAWEAATSNTLVAVALTATLSCAVTSAWSH